MTDELEKDLRRLLKPVKAPDGMAERILAALPARPAVATVAHLPRLKRRQPNYWLPGALAASVAGAVALGMFVAERHDARIAAREEAEGRAASQKLMQALRVTSQK